MRHLLRRIVCLTLAWAMMPLPAHAASTATVYTPIAAIPANAQSTPARPVIMLNMSKDHQLFYRAYNEFSDYNGDGQPDGGYIHANRYSGYFDPVKCYTYSNTNKRFAPSAAADASNYCSNAWSGNFLNWATMTRMDIVRKVLYGGTRSTDTATSTVLERASLPMDSHSFAKYYNGADISRLTPFSETEITLCNTTLDNNGAYSHTTTQPPLMRAARGNYSLWNAHERRQCRWDEETQWDDDGSGNGNSQAITGLAAASGYPVKSSKALSNGGATGDFVVRVEACVTGLFGGERCRQYPSGNYKPIGLLHEYGESEQAEFGLVTGSFSKNISGGVLRRNATSFAPEVNTTTDGTFVTNVAGIVATMNRLRIFGYSYSNGAYDNTTDGSCTYQLTGLSDNQCASWGNPIGEMFTETLRYLAGKTPANAYGNNADAKGATMNLPVETWVDPFTRGATINAKYGAPQCRAIDIINFNASVISYDKDTQAPFSDLGAARSLNSYVDSIGTGEGIANTSRFVGQTLTATDKACTAKTVGNLSDVEGLCPMAPAYHGSYDVAGAAYWAHTNSIRTTPTPTTNAKDPNFHVDSYSVALAPGVPRITIATSSNPPLKAIIQPSYRLQKPDGGVGNGTLVDFRVVSQTATSGKYLVVWEDSEQGGDYDQDASGILEWSLSGNTLRVTTSTFADATVNGQGFGYTISGTNKDGVHFHSGILNFNYNDPTNLTVTRTDGSAHPNINTTGGCSNCSKNQDPSRATYTVTGSVGGTLEDPLWYAAKWGGYKVTYTNGVADLPDTRAKWDTKDASGNVVAGGDGTPDNYFLVFNPDQLEDALRSVFQGAVAASNAAPAVSSSQLVTGGLKYLANFDIAEVSGDVQAFRINADGTFQSAAEWTAGQKLATVAAASRNVITNDGVTGVAFDWTTLSARPNYLAAMTTGATRAQTAAQAQATVNYMRGDRSGEGPSPTALRERPSSPNNILGPVVSAAPWIEDKPSARYPESRFEGYAAFAKAKATRQKVLWVASDDGMVHAFEANNGTPLFSYAPGSLAQRFNAIPQKGFPVTAYVDGTPFTADIWIDDSGTNDKSLEWHSYLFGSLGRGGRSIYALDVTDTGGLTQANAASIFKWEFTADDDVDLGYMITDVSTATTSGQASPIAKLNNGKFAMIVGNGYQSRDGKAALMIIPAEGPNSSGSWAGRYTKLVADAGTGNGLMGATWVDLDNNGTADVVYAGDLKGNLWKFDISSTNPSNWSVAYLDTGGAAQPLYTARSSSNAVLPIMAAPQYSFPQFGGVFVTFGTGLANTSSEFPRTSVTQRVFGIWDRPAFTVTPKTATRTRSLPTGTTTLVQRTYSRQSTGELIVTAGAAVDYENATPSLAKDGWYFDMLGSSEMVVSNLDFRLNTIFFTSIRAADAGVINCSQLPLATLYAIEPVSGLPTLPVLGTITVNGVTYYVAGTDVADQKVREVTDRTSLPSTPKSCVAGSPGCTCTTTNGVQTCTTAPPCPEGSAALRAIGRDTDKTMCFDQTNARIQWREIPGLRTKP